MLENLVPKLSHHLLRLQATVVKNPESLAVQAEVIRISEVVRILENRALGQLVKLAPKVDLLDGAGARETLDVQEAKQREVGRLAERVSSSLVEPPLSPVVYDSLEEKPFQTPIHLDRVPKQLVVKAIALSRQIVTENTQADDEMNDGKFDNDAKFRKDNNETTFAFRDFHFATSFQVGFGKNNRFITLHYFMAYVNTKTKTETFPSFCFKIQ